MSLGQLLSELPLEILGQIIALVGRLSMTVTRHALLGKPIHRNGFEYDLDAYHSLEFFLWCRDNFDIMNITLNARLVDNMDIVRWISGRYFEMLEPDCGRRDTLIRTLCKIITNTLDKQYCIIIRGSECSGKIDIIGFIKQLVPYRIIPRYAEPPYVCVIEYTTRLVLSYDRLLLANNTVDVARIVNYIRRNTTGSWFHFLCNADENYIPDLDVLDRILLIDLTQVNPFHGNYEFVITDPVQFHRYIVGYCEM